MENLKWRGSLYLYPGSTVLSGVQVKANWAQTLKDGKGR